MNEETRAQELMIAALYGELSPEEEREFESLIGGGLAMQCGRIGLQLESRRNCW